MPLAIPPFRRRLGASLALGVAGWLVLAPAAGVAHAEPTVVPLGVAKEFSVLAGSTITNTGPSTVNRSIGLFPGTDITGAGSLVVGGTTHAGDQRARTAKSDLTTAYNNAAGQTPRIAADSELAGETLVGGIYRRPAAMALNGALTLDGQNDPDSVWVFQAGSTLTAGSGSSIVLVRGADACNVFWQVGSSATIGTTTRFVGTIMADQSITMQTGARLRGRALARIGAVTLDTNVITSPQCDDDDTDGGGDGGTDGGGGDGGSDGGGDGGSDGGGDGGSDGGDNGGDGGTDSGGDNGGDGGTDSGGDNGGDGGNGGGNGGDNGGDGGTDGGGEDNGGNGGGDSSGGDGGGQIANPPSGGVPTGEAADAAGGQPATLVLTTALAGALALAGTAVLRRRRSW
ncbi:ice-binding family protein [Nocardioides dongxiaopingii]|uniref:ice-binding family protein n=1 Tax=Nocardioides dongxiaopingii TaxID=2576036 RepID=UPI001BB09FB3|nr:ice-binding family protein [Nocardioides dongxiaopingii]